MIAIKPSDRVHVEFDADVSEGSGRDPVLRVLIKDVDGTDWVSLVPRAVCTLIVPPVQVGDVVTAENIGQLPDGSILCPRGADWNPYQRRRGKWFEMCNDTTQLVNEHDIYLLSNVEVLRIGGGES